MTFSIFQLSEPQLCDFWAMLQRAGLQAVSKGFSHKVRLYVGSHSPCSSMAYWRELCRSERGRLEA